PERSLGPAPGVPRDRDGRAVLARRAAVLDLVTVLDRRSEGGAPMSAPRLAKLWVMIALVYAVFAVLVWFLGSWLALSGASIWLLRIGLWLLGRGAVGLGGGFLAG